MKRFADLLQTTPFPLWKTPPGNTISMSQFCDNVNVAAKGPTVHSEMCRVCAVLTDCWDLPVRCECLSKGRPCAGACMRQQLRILGVTIHIHNAVLCFSTPSALNNDWELKWGPSSHSPWAMSSGSLANIFTGPLINVLPFQFSWGCFLVSICAWMELAAQSLQFYEPSRQLYTNAGAAVTGTSFTNDTTVSIPVTAEVVDPGGALASQCLCIVACTT